MLPPGYTDHSLLTWAVIMCAMEVPKSELLSLLTKMSVTPLPPLQIQQSSVHVTSDVWVCWHCGTLGFGRGIVCTKSPPPYFPPLPTPPYPPPSPHPPLPPPPTPPTPPSPPLTPPTPPPYLPPPTFGSLRSTDGSLRSTRGPAPAPPLNNMTPAVATDRLLCFALGVHRLLCVPPCLWPLK